MIVTPQNHMSNMSKRHVPNPRNKVAMSPEYQLNIINMLHKLITLIKTLLEDMKSLKRDGNINILRIAKRVPVEHPRFAGENN